MSTPFEMFAGVEQAVEVVDNTVVTVVQPTIELPTESVETLFRVCKLCGNKLPIAVFYLNERKSGAKPPTRQVCNNCYASSGMQEAQRQRAREYALKYPYYRWACAAINRHKNKHGILAVDFDAYWLAELGQKTSHCPIDGKPLRWDYARDFDERGKARHDSPSLDRTNNELFLAKHNVQIVCFGCNSHKGARSMKKWYVDNLKHVQKFAYMYPELTVDLSFNEDIISEIGVDRA
jgi:hypothetical protein